MVVRHLVSKFRQLFQDFRGRQRLFRLTEFKASNPKAFRARSIGEGTGSLISAAL